MIEESQNAVYTHQAHIQTLDTDIRIWKKNLKDLHQSILFYTDLVPDEAATIKSNDTLIQIYKDKIEKNESEHKNLVSTLRDEIDSFHELDTLENKLNTSKDSLYTLRRERVYLENKEEIDATQWEQKRSRK